MLKTIATSQERSLGTKAEKIRFFLGLTQQELANLTGVSIGEVVLFEQNLPVMLDVRRRLLKELLARKTCNQ